MAKPKQKAPQAQSSRASWPWLVRVLWAHWRLFVCAGVGTAVFFALPPEGLPVPRFFFGWDAGVILYLVSIYRMIYGSETDSIRRQSALQDEGRYLVLLLATAAAVISLAVLLVWLSQPIATERHPGLDLILVFLTIPLSWAFIHTIFTLHYAHEYYAEHRGAGGGLRFPDAPKPNYWDFVYFSFGIGMAAQVADVMVTAERVRRIVTMHSIISFFFNVSLIALTVGILGDAIATK